MKFEYKFFQHAHDAESLAELNTLGSQGWEAVSTTITYNYRINVLLKRVIE